MFTGLIQSKGEILGVEKIGASYTFMIQSELSRQLNVGQSIAVNGVCVTARSVTPKTFEADLSEETLKRTTLGDLKIGNPVNLELPLTPQSFLGGHFVQGHVDTVGKVVSLEKLNSFMKIRISFPESYASLLVEKGSVSMDGVSLTVNTVNSEAPFYFEVMIIPETLEKTTIQSYQPGQKVNLELDILAKYIQRRLEIL